MKKLGIIVLSLFTLVAAGCIKDIEPFDFEAQLEIEKPIIAEYVAANLPDANYDERTSIWYEIVEAGDPDSYVYQLDVSTGLVVSPTVSVNYTGKLLSGEVFDSNNSLSGAEFNLGSLVTAWHSAFLPKMISGKETIGLTELGLKKGSVIRIVTPSYYAYQNNAYGVIPANSPLYFEIKVLNIK